MLKFLGYIRIIGVFFTFFVGYYIGFSGNGHDAVAQIHFMVPVIILSVAGTSGIEGLFFGKEAAKAKGFKSDSNYQIQSAIAMLSYCFGAIIVLMCNWGVWAELTILFTTMFFFVLSGINHARDAFVNHNYKWENINRPFLIFLLLVGLIYPVIVVLNII